MKVSHAIDITAPPQILLIKYTRTFSYLFSLLSLAQTPSSEFDLPSLPPPPLHHQSHNTSNFNINIENPNFNYGKVLRVNMVNMSSLLPSYRWWQGDYFNRWSELILDLHKSLLGWEWRGHDDDENGKCETFGKWLLKNQLLNELSSSSRRREERLNINSRQRLETHFAITLYSGKVFAVFSALHATECLLFQFFHTLSCVQFHSVSLALDTMLENTMQSSFI